MSKKTIACEEKLASEKLDRLCSYMERGFNILKISEVNYDQYFKKIPGYKFIPFFDAELTTEKSPRPNIAYESLNFHMLEVAIRSRSAVQFRNRHITWNHALRVALWTVAIAEIMHPRYDPDYFSALGMGSLQHDVGKWYVDINILEKPGKLTPEEIKKVIRHCVGGQRDLQAMMDFVQYNAIRIHNGELPENIKFLCKILEIGAECAAEHHEHVDGSGYPYGKKHYLLRPYTMILSVADCFDALTDPSRPYRTVKYSVEQAFDIIKLSAGIRYQNVIVDVLDRLIKRERPLVDMILQRFETPTQEIDQ